MTLLKFLPRLISLSFLAIGIYLLLQILWPQVVFKLQELSLQITTQPLTAPQASTVLPGVSIKATADNFPLIVSLNKRLDSPYQSFNLTVDKIGLKGETVTVDSNDLSLGLIHLPGSALPGEKGNVFVSGHSALPIFSKNKQAPFAKLSNLKIGDMIEVSALGAKFNYKVVNIKIVDPTDLSVISALDEVGRYISLMTCVPPGFNTKRLVVIGKLI